MKKLKEELKYGKKGITLISLVVTIIVLLILAGVTIATLTGDNGILTQAQKAKNETENAAKKEEEDLAKLEAIITGQDVPIVQVDDKNPGQLEQENDTTFVINSIEDLVFFSNDVTKGNNYSGKTVKLGTNLDFSSDKSYANPNRTDFSQYGYKGPLKQALTSETGFSPIGELSTTGTRYFYGTFDGDNNAICSMYINIDTDESVCAGLFSTCYGVVRNLGLVNTNITVYGLITAVGGITGRGYNNIYNCYVTGNINATGNSWMPVGGLCGVMQEEANIENCYNLANVNATNIQEEVGVADIGCGGIVGQGQVNINKCYNKGNIIVNGGNNRISVGGICGSPTNNATIENCYNNAKIEASSNLKRRDEDRVYIGGIIGTFPINNLQYCYNSGEIVGNAETLYMGGITGNLSGQNAIISNVFNIGKITIKKEKTEGAHVGGINGGNAGGNIQINNAYNTGTINVENLDVLLVQNIGSIFGNNWANSIKFNNCNYLAGTYNVGVGGSGSSTGVTQLDSIEDFPSVLSVVNGGNEEEGEFVEDTNNENNGYPILQWQ